MDKKSIFVLFVLPVVSILLSSLLVYALGVNGIASGKEVNEYVYSGTSQQQEQCHKHSYTGENEVNVVRNSEWKLIEEINTEKHTGTTTNKYELYNIRKDPYELNNVLDKEPLVANGLKAKLSQWIADTK